MKSGIQPVPKILLAEDDHTIAHMVLRVLQDGVIHDVTWVKDGQEALERVDEVKPDLLLLDLMMPHRNGFEVCRSLRDNSKWAGVPICILTALTDQQAHQAAIGAGADRILLKPFRANELRLAIRSLLEKEAAERFLVEALEKARTSQNDLVRFLAHDLRGPLTVLRSSLGILAKTVHDEIGVELIDSGKDAVVRLASMVDSILAGLDSSHINTLPMNDVFDLVKVVKDVSDELEVLFSARELTVVHQLHDAPCTMRGRRDLFRASVVNLIINAVEHSPLGGELIIQGLLSDDGDFQLRVTDQGPGIPPNVIEDIFVPEELSSLKARGVRLGRGLGLVVARAAVERLGGGIQIVEPHHKRFATAVQLEIPKSCFLSSASAEIQGDDSDAWTAPIRLALRLDSPGEDSGIFTTQLSHRGATLAWGVEDEFPEDGPLTISLAVSPQARTSARFILRDGDSIQLEWVEPSQEFQEFMQQVQNSLA